MIDIERIRADLARFERKIAAQEDEGDPATVRDMSFTLASAAGTFMGHSAALADAVEELRGDLVREKHDHRVASEEAHGAYAEIHRLRATLKSMIPEDGISDDDPCCWYQRLAAKTLYPNGRAVSAS